MNHLYLVCLLVNKYYQIDFYGSCSNLIGFIILIKIL